MGIKGCGFGRGTGDGCGCCGPPPACNVNVCLTGCGGAVLCGATVSAGPASARVGSTGCAVLAIPQNLIVGARVDITVIPDNPAYATITGTYDVACQTPPMSVTIAVPTTGEAAVCCSPGLIPMALALTDANGSHAFNYCAWNNGGTPVALWYACYAATADNTAQPDANCTGVMSYPVTGPTTILYTGECDGVDPATGRPIFRVTRSWSYWEDSPVTGNLHYTGVPPAGGGCKVIGTGTSGGSCNALGVNTFCLGPGGFGFTMGTHGGSSSGSATFDPCGAFAVSVPLTWDGCPTGFLCAEVSDPVGGGVAIS